VSSGFTARRIGEEAMSSSTAIGLIIANFLPGIFVYFYITKLANDSGAMIVTGVVDGTPVSMKYRWVMLHQTYSGYVLGAVAGGFMAALVNLRIADHVIDVDIKRLAYVAVVMTGTASFAWVVYGISEFILFRSVLREAESD